MIHFKKIVTISILVASSLFSNGEEKKIDLEEIRKSIRKTGVLRVLPDDLSVEYLEEPKKLIKLFKENKDKIYGGIDDFENFQTLQGLCDLIKSGKKSIEISDFLFSEFQTLSPLKDVPKNWQQLPISSRGGSLGLVIDCLLEIGGDDIFLKMFDSIVKDGDVQKMKSLLSVINMRKENEKYQGSINFRRLKKFDKVFDETPKVEFGKK